MLMRLAIASRLRLRVGAQQFMFPFRYVSGRSEIVRDLSELVSLSVRDSIRGFLVKAAAKVSQRNETTKLLSNFFEINSISVIETTVTDVVRGRSPRIGITDVGDGAEI